MNKEEDKKIEEYGVSKIQVLEGRDAVRKRPDMYTDTKDPGHIVREALDNVVDEGVAGYCSEAKITLSADQRTITVEDNGRGIPIGIHPQTKKSTLETIFTVLHAGGKFDDKVYKTSGGLHGVGVTVVNFLSENLKVWSKRAGKTEFLEFNEGILVNSKITETPKEKNGLIVTFTPDSKIFREINYFNIKDIQVTLKELAYLNSNLSFTFSFPPQYLPITYHFASGLAGWIKEINPDYLENTKICAKEWTNPNEKEYFHLNFAFQYGQTRKYEIKSFCNNISTIGGGTHVESFENGLVNACREWVKDKNPNLKVNILKEDVLEGLTTVLAIRMKDPRFAGQTKDRLNNKEIREIVRKNSYDLISKFLQDDGTSAEAIVKRISSNAQNRAKSEEFQKSLREGSSGSSLPGKLSPCISKDLATNELFIVEGESAGGSAKSARDPYNQAVLPLKGKIINVEKADSAKILANEEIQNLVNALGFSVNEATQNYYNRFRNNLEDSLAEEQLKNIEIIKEFTYQSDEGEDLIIPAHTSLTWEQINIVVEKTKQTLLKKLRYGKVIIMTDADPDGKHIECLALTFFVRYFRYLIEDHYLYLAVPPFYRLKNKQEIKYLYNDQELEAYRQQNKGNYTIQRFKGLGEMNPQQLRETTMAARKRCLHELLLPNPPSIREIIENLMGPKSEPRKKYLESGEHKNAQLTIVDNKVDLGQALLVKFLDYAYSVVEDRALPQLYDGLKPVQRRILFTLYQLNLLPNKAHRKASKVVGDVMGDYHPHGDSSIYQAMVKMAQDFSYRYPLVDGQGNWGSIDGDPAAAMRYTEARLTKFGAYLLEDLAFETIKWIDNYDETKKEPEILPANINLLLNGSSGIAVGMSTNIPPHNLKEVANATIGLIREPDLDLNKLLEYLPGPDFPTGGHILEQEKLKDIYEKGEGTLYIRAKAEITSSKQDKDGKISQKRDLIHITELPFKVNKANLIENISRIIKDKKIEGLRNVADYSSYENPVNIHLRFDPNQDGEVILNKLYKTTRLQNSFSVKMRALIDDQPKVFSLKEILQGFINKRLENIQKKAQFLYQKNQKELKNLETRLFIINNYQEIAEIVRSVDLESERDQKLKDRFDLEQEAVERILDTSSSFRQFTPEKREKLQNDINNLHQDSTEQQLVIGQQDKRKEKLIQELEELKANYIHDKRKTILTDHLHSIEERQLIPHEERIILLSRSENKKEDKINSYLTVHSISALEPTNIPSQGKKLTTRGDNWAIIKLDRRDDLWCFSNYGRLYSLSFYKFAALNKVTNLDQEYFFNNQKKQSILRADEFFTAVLPVKEEFANDNEFLIIITKNGKIKQLELAKLKKISKTGKKIVNLYQKTVKECSFHQTESAKHKNFAHVCGIGCVQLRELRKQIKECNNCQEKWTSKGDEIAKAVLIKGTEELEAIIKRKSKDDKVKNLKVPIYRQMRSKNQDGSAVYCPTHQTKLKNHKTANCCDKKAGVKAYSACSQFKKLRQEIKKCLACQSPTLFTKQMKKQLKCQQIVDILVVNKAERENLILFLIKKDNSCEKKLLSTAKTWIGSDSKLRKTNYCRKHWSELDKLEKIKEETENKLQETKELIEEKVLKSTLPIEAKKEVLKDTKIIKGAEINKDLAKKLANSPLDLTMSELAVKSQIEALKQEGVSYQKLVKEDKTQQDKISEFKEKSKQCRDCRKYCAKHQQQTEEQMTKHENCPHCSKNVKQAEQVNKKLVELQTNLEKLGKNQGKEKEIQKLNGQINKQKEESKKMRYEAFANRVKCPILNKLKLEKKDCADCQTQAKKKYKTIWQNPLQHALLVNKKIDPEIYLLAKEDVCWYNKKDLTSFLENESRSKNFLKNKQKEITDIKVYSKAE